MPLVESRGFSFDLDTFEAKLSPRTKMVVLNSPANPTGGVIPKEDLKRIADLVRDRDVLIVLSDEIYSRICYEEEPESITQFDGMLEKTIILDGFSKTYSMTGWRLGYGVMPLWLVDAVEQLMVNSNSCTASFTQRAGLAALQGPQDCVDAMVAEFRRRRDAIVKGLNEIPGLPLHACRPARSTRFPNVNGTGVPSRELADLLLNEAGVSCLSGTAFGSYGDGYLRFSYANSLENIQEALARIRHVSRALGDVRSRQVGDPLSSIAPTAGAETSRSSTSLGTARRQDLRAGRASRERVLDADVQLLLGHVDDRLDRHHHAGLERQVPVADVVHGHADVVPDVGVAGIEAVLLEDVLGDLLDRRSRVTPGLIAAMIAFCASSTHSYALSCASVKRPDTGHVRVMSIVR